MRKLAWLLLLLLLAVVAVRAICPPGPPGEECRAKCTRACSGNTECEIDDCGVARCTVCNAHGAIDYRTDLCICNPDRGGRGCEYYLQGAPCSMGHSMELAMLEPVYSSCNASTLHCIGGAVRYAESLASEINGEVECSPPYITAFTPIVLSAGHAYKTYIATNRTILLVEDTGFVRDEAVLWYAFVRVSRSEDVYTIHSAVDMRRTIETFVAPGGYVHLRWTDREVLVPALWSIPGGPTSDGIFTVARYARQSSTEYLRADIAAGHLVVSADESLPNTFTMRARNGLVIGYSPPGANVTFVTSGNLCQSSPNPAPVIDPAACLAHCQKELTCNAAEWTQAGGCWLLTHANGHGTPTVDSTSRTWNITARPFADDPTRVSAHSCIVPGGRVRCKRPSIGPVRLSDALNPSVNLHVDLATQTLGTSARAGTEEQSDPSFIPKVRGWLLISTFGIGNEYTIAVATQTGLVLASDSDGHVYLDSPNSASGQVSLTWLINGTLADAAPFRLVVPIRPDLGAIVSSRGMVVRRASALASLGWRDFVMQMGNYDPFVVYDYSIAEIDSPDFLVERMHTPLFTTCFGECMVNRRCRGLVLDLLTSTCTLFGTWDRRPLPAPVRSNYTLLSYMIKSQIPGYLLSAPNQCGPGSFPTHVNHSAREEFVYSTPMSRGTFPDQLCLPPQSGPVLMFPASNLDLTITVARELDVVLTTYQTFTQPIKAEPDFTAPTPQFWLAYDQQYGTNTRIQMDWRASAVVLVSTGDPDTYIIYLEAAPNRTLELSAAVDYELLGTQPLRVGFYDVSNQRATAWRIRGMSSVFTGTRTGPFAIEFADHAGIVLCGVDDATTPITMAARAGVSTQRWAFTFGAMSKRPGNEVLQSTGFFIGGGVDLLTTLVLSSLVDCLGAATMYRHAGAINYDASTGQCSVFILHPQGGTTPTPLDPVPIRGARPTNVFSAVVGLFVAVQGHAPSETATYECISNANSSIPGTATVGFPCRDVTCVGHWKYASDDGGCVAERRRPKIVLKAPYLGTGNSSFIGVADARGDADSWILLEVGTGLYHVCLERSVHSGDDNNIGYSITQLCLRGSTSNDSVVELVDASRDRAQLLSVEIAANLGTAHKSSSALRLEDTPRITYLRAAVDGAPVYLAFDANVNRTRTRFSSTVDLSQQARYIWEVAYRAFASPAMRVFNGPYLRANTAVQDFKNVATNNDYNSQFHMYAKAVLATYLVEDEDLCRGFMYDDIRSAGYFFYPSPAVSVCVIPLSIGFTLNTFLPGTGTQVFVNDYYFTYGSPWRRGGTISQELMNVPYGHAGLVDGHGNGNISFPIVPENNAFGNVSFVANQTITYGFLRCDAIADDVNDLAFYDGYCVDSVLTLYMSRTRNLTTAGLHSVLAMRLGWDGQVVTNAFPNAPEQNVIFDDTFGFSHLCYPFCSRAGLNRALLAVGAPDHWRPVYMTAIFINDHPTIPFGSPGFLFALRVPGIVKKYVDPLLNDQTAAPADLFHPFTGSFLCTYTVPGYNVTSVRLRTFETGRLETLPKECTFQSRYLR